MHTFSFVSKAIWNGPRELYCESGESRHFACDRFLARGIFCLAIDEAIHLFQRSGPTLRLSRDFDVSAHCSGLPRPPSLAVAQHGLACRGSLLHARGQHRVSSCGARSLSSSSEHHFLSTRQSARSCVLLELSRILLSQSFQRRHGHCLWKGLSFRAMFLCFDPLCY